jgi:AcrR family transcriptional regulator
MRIGIGVDLRHAEGEGGTDWAADRPSGRSLKALQVALQETTEVLASELCNPTSAAPAWSENEWAVARAVAAIHGVSPLLADTLRWHGPTAWARFLAEQKVHTAQRFQRIAQLLQLIDKRAREAGIGLVPLKGAALHAMGIYAAGQRPMADIDLLVREEQSQRAVEVFAGLGFRETYRSWKDRVFEQAGQDAPGALGEDSRNGMKLELHCRIAEVLPRYAVDVTEIVFPQALHPGLNAYPSKAALLIHLLLHAAGALIERALRLLQLHDIARLSARMNDEDWEELLRAAARTADGTLWWAFPPLALVARYYSCVPDKVLTRAANDCHWILKRVYRRRKLSAASLSHLWVSALPGIEWARSPLAMFAYAAARVVPSAETVYLRKALANLQPRVCGGTWGQLSQRQRMLRWMISHQARHATLQPVRAALREAH